MSVCVCVGLTLQQFHRNLFFLTQLHVEIVKTHRKELNEPQQVVKEKLKPF